MVSNKQIITNNNNNTLYFKDIQLAINFSISSLLFYPDVFFYQNAGGDITEISVVQPVPFTVLTVSVIM